MPSKPFAIAFFVLTFSLFCLSCRVRTFGENKEFLSQENPYSLRDLQNPVILFINDTDQTLRLGVCESVFDKALLNRLACAPKALLTKWMYETGLPWKQVRKVVEKLWFQRVQQVLAARQNCPTCLNAHSIPVLEFNLLKEKLRNLDIKLQSIEKLDHAQQVILGPETADFKIKKANLLRQLLAITKINQLAADAASQKKSENDLKSAIDDQMKTLAVKLPDLEKKLAGFPGVFSRSLDFEGDELNEVHLVPLIHKVISEEVVVTQNFNVDSGTYYPPEVHKRMFPQVTSKPILSWDEMSFCKLPYEAQLYITKHFYFYGEPYVLAQVGLAKANLRKPNSNKRTNCRQGSTVAIPFENLKFAYVNLNQRFPPDLTAALPETKHGEVFRSLAEKSHEFHSSRLERLRTQFLSASAKLRGIILKTDALKAPVIGYLFKDETHLDNPCQIFEDEPFSNRKLDPQSNIEVIEGKSIFSVKIKLNLKERVGALINKKPHSSERNCPLNQPIYFNIDDMSVAEFENFTLLNSGYDKEYQVSLVIDPREMEEF
jgi:hypothetical protein